MWRGVEKGSFFEDILKKLNIIIKSSLVRERWMGSCFPSIFKEEADQPWCDSSASVEEMKNHGKLLLGSKNMASLTINLKRLQRNSASFSVIAAVWGYGFLRSNSSVCTLIFAVTIQSLNSA